MDYARACSIAENARKLVVSVQDHCRRFRSSFEAATKYIDVTDDDSRSPLVTLESIAADPAHVDELRRAARRIRLLHSEAQKILEELGMVSSELYSAHAAAKQDQPVLRLAVEICCRITEEFDSFFSSHPPDLGATEACAASRGEVHSHYLMLYLIAGLVEDEQSPADVAQIWGYVDPGVFDGRPSIRFAFEQSDNVVSALYRLAETQLRDGPLAGLLWVKGGEAIKEQMMPTAWNFVNFLWDKSGKSCRNCSRGSAVLRQRRELASDDF